MISSRGYFHSEQQYLCSMARITFTPNIFHMIIKESEWAPRATKAEVFSVLLRELRGHETL